MKRVHQEPKEKGTNRAELFHNALPSREMNRLGQTIRMGTRARKSS
jgi:hypothetical protein